MLMITLLLKNNLHSFKVQFCHQFSVVIGYRSIYFRLLKTFSRCLTKSNHLSSFTSPCLKVVSGESKVPSSGFPINRISSLICIDLPNLICIIGLPIYFQVTCVCQKKVFVLLSIWKCYTRWGCSNPSCLFGNA